MEHGLCHQLMRIFASRVKLVRDGFNIDAFLKEQDKSLLETKANGDKTTLEASKLYCPFNCPWYCWIKLSS